MCVFVFVCLCCCLIDCVCVQACSCGCVFACVLSFVVYSICCVCIVMWLRGGVFVCACVCVCVLVCLLSCVCACVCVYLLVCVFVGLRVLIACWFRCLCEMCLLIGLMAGCGIGLVVCVWLVLYDCTFACVCA